MNSSNADIQHRGLSLYTPDGGYMEPHLSSTVMLSMDDPDRNYAYEDWIRKVGELNNVNEVQTALYKVAGVIEKRQTEYQILLAGLPAEIRNDPEAWFRTRPYFSDVSYRVKELFTWAKIYETDLRAVSQLITRFQADLHRINEHVRQYHTYSSRLICIRTGSYVTDFIMVAEFEISDRIFTYGNTVKECLIEAQRESEIRRSGRAGHYHDYVNKPFLARLLSLKKFTVKSQRPWSKTRDLIIGEVVRLYNKDGNATIVLDTKDNTSFSTILLQARRSNTPPTRVIPIHEIERTDIPIGNDEKVMVIENIENYVPVTWYEYCTTPGVI